MPSPPLPANERICAAYARDGYVCKYSNCRFIHEKDVTKWPAAAFMAWDAMVDTTPGLSWNPIFVGAKTVKLKLSTDNKTAADVTAAKNK
jgi:hypothetical protein